ncbi:MAG: DUF6356 family protein [Gammaproteobacteria bacterium]
MNPFTAHPHAAGQTYAQHWSFAMGVAAQAFVTAVAAAIHAFLPFVLQTTASRRLQQLHERIAAAQRPPA